MQIQVFTFNPFQENTYIAYDEQKNAVIIDPGCSTHAEQETMVRFIEQNELQIKAILNTHCHIDHVFGNAAMVEKYSVEIYTHQGELQTLAQAQTTADMYGFSQYVASPIPTQFLEEGERIVFGEMEFEVLFIPGHSIAHIAFYNEKEGVLFGGDVLFKGSFGRYDLPGGNLKTLQDSIINHFFKLPADTIVLSGHGPQTTIGEEKESNPIYHFG